MYIPPRIINNPHQNDHDAHIIDVLTYLTSTPNTIITTDSNAHSPSWFSNNADHRGILIHDFLDTTSSITLNTNNNTRVPNSIHQAPTSPDITIAPTHLALNTHWQVLTALASDHLPILITLNTKTNFRLTQHRRSYTNYKKANWELFTQDIENTLTNTAPVTNVHTSTQILTKAILMADKHHIPKGRIKDTCSLLPLEIRKLIAHRDNTRKQNPTDNTLTALNNNIDSAIQKHKAALWQEKISGNWDHKTNTHILWQTIHNLQNKKPTHPKNTTINFNNKTVINNSNIATAFNKQFTNTVTHTTNKNNRLIDRAIHNLQGDRIALSTNEISHAIKHSKNNNSLGPDNINIRHLKHLGHTAINYLTDIFNLSLNTNNIPSIWKLANIIPIIKPDKSHNLGTSYRPISLISPIAKALEKSILPYITSNIPNITHQHGFKANHSTTTALHNINNAIAHGFNQPQPPHRTITVALDMSKAFDTVNIHTLTSKLQHTNTPPTIVKYVSNYIKGRKAYTTYNNTTSSQKIFHTGVPQGGVLSPTLFNIYTSDIPTPHSPVNLSTYADDISTTSTHTNIQSAEQNIQPYLADIHTWTQNNNLHLNASKTTATLFTPDPAEYQTKLNLSINTTPLPYTHTPKILGVTFDTKHTYSTHINNTCTKARKTINILKALQATHWGKQKETLLNTYKTITRPILEYASTIWSPIASHTNINKLQIIQNNALRIATGCTRDTNIQHLHDECSILPLTQHMQIHASQLLQKSQHPDHPLHPLTLLPHPPRTKKPTIFHNNAYTINIPTDNTNITHDTIKQNMRIIHTRAVQTHLNNRQHNKLINCTAPPIHSSEQGLCRAVRRTLAQLRTDKSPILHAYLHKISPDTHPSPLCPLCTQQEHTTTHLFNCTHVPSCLSPLDLWTNPVGVVGLLSRWGAKVPGWPEELGPGSS
jgi:hypothetical protein